MDSRTGERGGGACYLRLWQSDVQDVGLTSRLAVLQPGEDDLVAPDLAVLFAL